MSGPLRVAFVTLGDPNTLTGGYLYHLRMAELATREKAQLEFVSVPERPFPLGALSAGRLMRQVMDLEPQAVVLDSICAGLVGPRLAIKTPPLPLLAMLHQPPGGVDHRLPRARLQAVVDMMAYRKASRLLLASQTLVDDLVRRGIAAENLRVIPPGRDVAPTPSAAPIDLRCGRLAAFLCVGNWVRPKGIYELLEAFSRLPSNAGTLHLVGGTEVDASYTAKVLARLSKSDLCDRVVVHGAVSREEVATLYRSADVFVLPSFIETYGTVYGEAMDAGLPVVGWRLGNLPNLATDGQEGLVLEPGDIAGLTQALRMLAEDVELRCRLGQAAQQRAASRPTWAQTATMFYAAIREVVESSAG